MSEKEYSVAVVGATGVVGQEMIDTLSQRGFPVASLKLLASERSAGEEVDFNGEQYVVEELNANSFQDIDLALFSAGSSVSKEYAPIAAEAGAVVIDNSSAFRMNPEIALVVPEVNADDLREKLAACKERGHAGLIIANPNCAAIQLLVALKPLHDHATVKRVVMSTYQSVAGAGKNGIEELWNQTLAIFNQKEIEASHFSHQIAFNCIPQVDTFNDGGDTFEEQKIIEESRKVLGESALPMSVTAVRVPVFSCHSESVNVEFENEVSVDNAREILRESPGVIVVDEPKDNAYPIGVDVAGTDATYVGRIRKDSSVKHGLNLWIVADNLRKGAALNAVQIAELVANNR